MFKLLSHLDKRKRSQTAHTIDKIHTNPIDVIDLCTPTKESMIVKVKTETYTAADTSIVSTTNNTEPTTDSISKRCHTFRTLPMNSKSRSILPGFPIKINDDDQSNHLLWANVPRKSMR